jgi:hypothetical protein
LSTGFLSNSFSAYPNPAHSQIILEIPAAVSNREMLIELVDFQGRIIQRKKMISSQEVLNVSEVPVGMYHLIITTPSEVRVMKWVIQR